MAIVVFLESWLWMAVTLWFELAVSQHQGEYSATKKELRQLQMGLQPQG